MHICDEDTAKFMGKSLLSHAKEVYRYALAYCVPYEGNEYIAPENRVQFVKNLERMLKELYALMLMARYKGISRYCNREQIEAYMNSAAELIAPERHTIPAAMMN